MRSKYYARLRSMPRDELEEEGWNAGFYGCTNPGRTLKFPCKFRPGGLYQHEFILPVLQPLSHSSVLCLQQAAITGDLERLPQRANSLKRSVHQLVHLNIFQPN